MLSHGVFSGNHIKLIKLNITLRIPKNSLRRKNVLIWISPFVTHGTMHTDITYQGWQWLIMVTLQLCTQKSPPRLFSHILGFFYLFKIYKWIFSLPIQSKIIVERIKKFLSLFLPIKINIFPSSYSIASQKKQRHFYWYE